MSHHDTATGPPRRRRPGRRPISTIPSVRFVEVDVDTTAYEQSHIPGASPGTGPASCPTASAATSPRARTSASCCPSSGIGPDTTIVLYGDNNNWFAAWAYWQLRLYGHTNVRILDGGRKYWLDQGLPLTTDVPAYRGHRLRAARARLRSARLPRRHPASARRPRARARRRPVAGRVQRRGHRARRA